MIRLPRPPAHHNLDPIPQRSFQLRPPIHVHHLPGTRSIIHLPLLHAPHSHLLHPWPRPLRRQRREDRVAEQLIHRPHARLRLVRPRRTALPLLEDQALERGPHRGEEDGPLGADVGLLSAAGGAAEVEPVPGARFAEVERCERGAFAREGAEQVLHRAGRVEVRAVGFEGARFVPGLARLAVREGGAGRRGGGGAWGLCSGSITGTFRLMPVICFSRDYVDVRARYYPALLKVVEVQMQQVLRLHQQDRGGQSVGHDPGQTDRGRGREQDGRDAVDERHGMMSRQPCEVELSYIL